MESQAKKMLLQGLEHMVSCGLDTCACVCVCVRVYIIARSLSLQNPAQVGVALQVFYNMSQLETALVSVLTGYTNAVQHSIQNAVDPSSLLGPGTVAT